MVRKNESIPPFPLRKGEISLTYVGMLIATTQEKRKQEGLVMGFPSSLTQR